MKCLKLLVCFLLSFNAYTQVLFQKTYENHQDQIEEGLDVHILEDGYLIVGTGNDGNEIYSYLKKINEMGNEVWTREYDEFYGLTMRTAINDSILYMPGEVRKPDGNLESDGYRLYRFDLDGRLIDSRKYDLSSINNPPVDSIRRYSPYGNIIFDDKIIMYGEVFEQNYSEKPNVPFGRGLMMWYNMDMTLDTIIFIQPRYKEVDIWDASIDPNGLLTLLVDDDTFINGVESHFRRFEKYDSKGNKVWSSEPVFLPQSRSLFLQSAILENGDMIMYYDDIDKRSRYLVSVGEDGSPNWTHRVDPNFSIDSRFIFDIQASIDSHILIGGKYEDNTSDRQGTYLAKHSYRTGELLWERVYQDWTDSLTLAHQGLPLSALISNIKVDDNGRIVAVGQSLPTKESGVRNKDIVLASFDQNGCLTSDCGGFEQTVAGEPRFYHIFYEGALWYHQNPEANGGIYQVMYRSHPAIRDTGFIKYRRDWELDPTVPEGGFGAPIHFFEIGDEGRKVYSTGETGSDERQLIYDFTLDVGDVFSSTYVNQDLEVIDSDTILLINGAKRRTWTLACTGNSQNTITWIEGIGSHYGMLWPKNFCAGDYGDVRLTCYYVYERLHYVNPDIGGCFISSTDDEQYNSALSNITIFPNPTSSRLTISSPELGIQRVDILDVQGQTQSVHYDNVREIQYDLQGYVPGLYFFSVHTEKGQVVKKVVVE